MKPIPCPYASKQAASAPGTLYTACKAARRALMALPLSLVLLVGCTKDKTAESEGGHTAETITVPVTLTPEFMGGVTVKSAGTADAQATGANGTTTAETAAPQAAEAPARGNESYASHSLMNVSAYTGPEAIAMAEAANRTIAYAGFNPSAATRSQTGVDESLVSDVWFVQLNAAGTAALQPPVYLKDGELSATRLPLELVGKPSIIYFLANSHDPALMSPTASLSSFTKEVVEALSKTYAAATIEQSLTSQGMPMAGRWEGVPSGDAIAVPLKRALAKVTINLSAQLPAGHSFSPKFIQICRVPSTLTLYRDPATATSPYPASSSETDAFTDYAREDISTVTIGATPVSFVYYLPENARGTGTATKQQEKTADFAPGASAAEGPFCTRVEVTGHYDDGSGAELTRYTIFLGADNTSDYNLKRNHAYGVDITLKGGSSNYDVRIKMLPIPIESTEADKTKITLQYNAGASGLFTISDVSGLEWTVRSADPSWLKIATTSAGTDATDSKTGTGTQTYYAYATSEPTKATRSAEITVSRFGPPEGVITATQKPQWIRPSMHNGWAGCNVYWDGSKLTFDDVGVTTHEKYQGVVFKPNSLVALSPSLQPFTPALVLHSPNGTVYPTWLDIQMKSDGATADMNISYALSVHDPAQNQGDICKYITDKGWAPPGKTWRLPTLQELQIMGHPNTYEGTRPSFNIVPDPHGKTESTCMIVWKNNALRLNFNSTLRRLDSGSPQDMNNAASVQAVYASAGGIRNPALPTPNILSINWGSYGFAMLSTAYYCPTVRCVAE